MRIKFIQDIIDTIRGKKKTKEPKKTISQEILANNNISIPKKNIKNFNLVLHGKNNTIILNENNRLSDNAIINISLNGDNNFIIFNEGFGLSSYLSIEVGLAGNPAKIVKSGVTWDSNTVVHNYVQNKIPIGEI